ncbi:F-box domain-containing protein [Mycena sanguinolenta]|uniref:F-box domain-containing protein n=1 Tax=Mycena sanguinolenta TaxID=230812 RepID=A0A8H6YSM3_9AGAR|nr:F-box domain-containing protein [Mycena sanguinolenta]
MPSFNPTLFGSPSLASVENQVKGLIATAEANIERLTTQIRELNLLREKERSILATLRLMVVPIGKLPTELLVEIFKLVVGSPDYPTCYFEDKARATLHSVLCLSQVSPYWRQIVHNAPQLWARNFIEICVDRESEKHYLDGVEALLARSNPLPVSIALVQIAWNSNHTDAFKTIARIVTSTAYRLKILRIDMPDLCFLNDLPPKTFEAPSSFSLSNVRRNRGIQLSRFNHPLVS